METAAAISQFTDHIRTVVDLRDDEAALLASSVTFATLQPKEFLFTAGQVSSHMRYIASGCMRSYYLTEDSEEHTLQIGVEHWWINDLYSYLTQQPSRMYLQALEPTLVLQIHRDVLEKLYREIPAMNTFFRLKIQSGYVALQERTLDNMSTDTFEKYVKFCTQYRHIEQRVPQYIIASYLGTTPENLSYLRKKYASRLS
ncbi:Crp/Fnr family transcriptional regulator [Flavobacterium silvisoli]|uniref:Crp/Fnr family transcriptional regulator n=1 Tax=Flavobacterium silvisoli TaxID=2529433 RepID=A0A4Q9Z763_9FLAO|nr:Crp/Fnr family transcriptional regulator [Flavobacterium silvisoli]TBX69903.1 Crp/Fnr family transcriptional regulator [Flavobacterium silvisoli]